MRTSVTRPIAVPAVQTNMTTTYPNPVILPKTDPAVKRMVMTPNLLNEVSRLYGMGGLSHAAWGSMMSLAGERPGSIIRWLFRVPLFLYDMGLKGWERVLGIRFLKITTRGRRTGRPHSVLVDLLEHDLVNDVYYVESSYGERADWVRNIKANPIFEAQVGRRRFTAVAERAPGHLAADILLRYISGHRLYARNINRIVGIDLESFTNDELRERLMGEMVLAIKPIDKKP